MKKSGLLIVSVFCMVYQNMMSASMELSKVDQELLTAARLSDIAKVKTALAAGANPNAQYYDGDTALMSSLWSVWPNYLIDAIPLLLRAGAKVGLRNLLGDTAFFYADSEQAVKLLIDAMHVQSQQLVKIMKEQGFSKEEQEQQLMRQGLSINSQNNNKKTALMNFILHGNIAIASQIIDFGADLDKQDNDGKKALNFVLFHLFNIQRQQVCLLSDSIAILKQLKNTENFEEALTSEIQFYIDHAHQEPSKFMTWLFEILDPVIAEINEENEEEKKYIEQYAITLNISNTPVEVLLHNLVECPIRLPSEIAEKIMRKKSVKQ